MLETIQPAGSANDTAMIQAAIDATSAAGGGTVTFAPGLHRAAALRLRSGVTLHLEAGATLKACDDITAYDRLGHRVGLIWADEADDVAITGRGTLDGNGDHFADKTRRHHSRDWEPTHARQSEAFLNPDAPLEAGPWLMPERPPTMIMLVRCRRPLIEGVRIVNSPHWTLHFGDCQRVRATNLLIENPQPIPNNDGIHVTSCRDVIISGCHIDCGDDAIAISGVQWEPHFGDAYRGRYDACENVIVSDCVLRSRSSGLRVGWGENPVRHVTAGNLIIQDTNRGINVCGRAGGGVEDATFHDITIDARLGHGHWWGMGEAIHVSSEPLRLFWTKADTPALAGDVRRVRFSNVRATSDCGVFVWSNRLGDVGDLDFNGCDFITRRGELESTYGGNRDLRANTAADRQIFESEMAGVHLRHVERVRLSDVSIKLDADLPDYWTSGLLEEGCREVACERLRINVPPDRRQHRGRQAPAR
jgi:polygalacturonase